MIGTTSPTFFTPLNNIPGTVGGVVGGCVVIIVGVVMTVFVLRYIVAYIINETQKDTSLKLKWYTHMRKDDLHKN